MMKTVGTIAAIAVGANALVARDATCCFGLTASGGASGTIGQLGDGQNRIGGGLPPAQFCIDSSGGIKDSSGRGCILTPPTSQFQCDQGAAPTNGFSISPEGTLLYQGSSHFVACETGDNGELNLYTNPPSNAVTGCKEITLTASGCKGQGSGSSSSSSVSPSPHSSASLAPHSSAPVPHSSAPVPHSSAPAPQSSTPAESSTPAPHSSAPAETSAPSSKSSAPGPQSSAPVPGSSAKPTPTETHASTSTPQPSASSSGCPTNLSGTYEYPHLIVPIDSSAPSKAYGTSYNGTVTSTVSSIFNFDIPASDSGKQCSLVFLFPEKKDLETSSYSFSGNGAIDFAQLQSPATQSTTYSNAPAVKTDYGVTTVSPGNSYRIATFSCPAGETVAFEMKNAGTTNLNFFEDYNPSPLGLYITVC